MLNDSGGDPLSVAHADHPAAGFIPRHRRKTGELLAGRRSHLLWLLMLVVILTSACGNELDPPTRTPVPTWTPTPLGGEVQPPAEVAQPVAEENQPPPTQQPAQEAAPPPTDTPTQEPPSPTPAFTDTPVATPTTAATDTPTPLPTSSPTPTPQYTFELETAEKLSTDSLAPDVVRIYLYVYSPSSLGLADYSLQVLHNGVPLLVDEVSTAGARRAASGTLGYPIDR
jgi:hypothetical protein